MKAEIDLAESELWLNGAPAEHGVSPKGGTAASHEQPGRRAGSRSTS